MGNKRFVVKLSSEERKCLDARIFKGRTSAKIILKAYPAESGSVRGGVRLDG